MSASRIDASGKVTRLDGKAEPEEVITEADVQDPAKLAKMLQRALGTIADLRREARPRRIDFRDQPVTVLAGTTLTLQHNFNGAVNWWLTDMDTMSSANRTTATTKDTLVIFVSPSSDGTVSVRVEEVG